MHKDKMKKSKGKGTLYLMTNELPNIPLYDEALLWRLLIYELPNRFTATGDGEDEYKMDINLFTRLEKDREGLQWLINASIKCYLTETFDRPSLNEIKTCIGGSDEIRDWIIRNTGLSNDDVLTNSEIVDYILDAYSDLEARLPRQKIARRVGKELRDIYGAKLQTERSPYGMKYNIEIV
jgi:phage/plasmid-associated DNA primase